MVASRCKKPTRCTHAASRTRKNPPERTMIPTTAPSAVRARRGEESRAKSAVKTGEINTPPMKPIMGPRGPVKSKSKSRPTSACVPCLDPQKRRYKRVEEHVHRQIDGIAERRIEPLHRRESGGEACDAEEL